MQSLYLQINHTSGVEACGVRVKPGNGKQVFQCFKTFRFKAAKISEFQAFFFNLCLSLDLRRGLVWYLDYYFCCNRIIIFTTC